MKKWIIGLCLLALCSCGQSVQTNKAQETKQPITIESETPQFSNELDTRFQQIFHDELSAPEHEAVEMKLRKTENTAIPSYRFYDSYTDEAGRMKGAFYFVEPTYSIDVKSADDAVIRGIYDIGYEELDNVYRYNSFVLTFEGEAAILKDLVLSTRVSSFIPQEQVIPLVRDGNTWTAQFDTMTDILDNDLTSGHSFSLEGVVEYNGNKYPFESPMDIRL